jgi:small subunit ribosomal protein S5
MAEFIEESSGLESTTIGIYRTSATVKGGRRFAFGALVVVGDRNGSVGLGYAKAPGVPNAIEKAQKYARKNMRRITLQEGTLPHGVTGKFSASSVKILPASPGTGVIAGGTLRAVLEMAGVRDCLTKCFGSTNQKNMAKAAMDGLEGLRNREKIQALRGVELPRTIVEEKLEAGRRWAPTVAANAGPRGPQAARKKDDRKGGRPGGNKGRGRRNDREQGSGPGAAPEAGSAPAAE